MIHQQWQLWLLGWALAVALLGTLYLVQLRTRDATAVDVGWAMSVTLIAVLDAVVGPGDLSHRALIRTTAGSRTSASRSSSSAASAMVRTPVTASCAAAGGSAVASS